MAHIIISLKGPGTECVAFLTIVLYQQMRKTMYFLSEEF